MDDEYGGVMQGTPLDTVGRPIRDLRVSVTDRCNFRCTYCMPKERFGDDHRFLPRDQLLTFEEIARCARVATTLGVTKVRITGGEPLLRAGIERLVAMLDSIDAITDLTMTTNGSLLARLAGRLAGAGLDRVSVSLDSVDDTTFRAMNDVGFGIDSVLEGIEAAADAGLGPVKVNAVVIRGINDHQVVDMARFFRGSGHIVRFIEFMDVGTTNGWQLDRVVTADEIVRTVGEAFPLEPLEAAYRGEVATRYRYRDGAGEIGVISSVSRPFCGDCTRLRISPDGSAYTCLFAPVGHDLRQILRSGTDDDLARALAAVWRGRSDRYSELRAASTAGNERVEMSYIGG